MNATAPLIEGKTLLVRPHSAGFFSNFNKVISCLHHRLGEDGIEAVTVDWTLPWPIPQFPYGTASDGNVWDRLFTPLQFPHFPTEKRVIEEWEWDNSMPTARKAYYMYKTQGWRERYHAVFDRYVHVRPDLINRVEQALGGTGAFLIGVHYRHPGHNYECPSPIAPASVFIERARVLARDKDNWRVVLATDVAGTLAEFQAAFGERLIHQSGIARSTDHTQLHETAAFGEVGAAEAVLVDALMLSRCNALLHVTSNIATAVGYMNPKLQMQYVETPLEALSARLLAHRIAITSGPLGKPLRIARRGAGKIVRGGRTLLRSRSERDGKIFFFHLPKTAGSSLWAVLGGLTTKDRMFQVSSDAKLQEFVALPTAARDRLKIVGGHFRLSAYREHLKLADYFCVTSFREPIARAQSEYYYTKYNRNHSEHGAVSGLSLSEFVERSPNPITRMLSDGDDPRVAFDIVRDVFDRWVFIDDLGVLANELRQRAGLPIAALPRLNIGPRSGSWPRLDDETLASIRHHHAADIELYGMLLDSYSGEADSESPVSPREPVFHIVTPIFNIAAYLDETIQSVLSQAGNFSIRYHIQDGGSTDASMAIVRRWQAQLNGGQVKIACRRVTLTATSQRDAGMYDALRAGFAKLAPPAESLMTWINGDDRLAPGALAHVTAVFRDLPEVDLVGGRPAVIDTEGRSQGAQLLNVFPRSALAAGLHDSRYLPCVMQEGTFWRARLWNKVGGTDSRYRLAGDWDLWRRFAEHADYVTLDKTLAYHRRRPGQLSEDMERYLAEIDILGPGSFPVRDSLIKYEDALADARGDALTGPHGLVARRNIRRRWYVTQEAAPIPARNWLERDGDWVVGDGFGQREGPFPKRGIVKPFYWTTSSVAQLALHSSLPGKRTVSVDLRCKELLQEASIRVGRSVARGRPKGPLSKQFTLQIEHDFVVGPCTVEIGVDRLRRSGDGRMLGVMVTGVRFIDAASE